MIENLEKVSQLTYKPQYKPGQLILGTGRAVVITGWTPKQAVAKKLKPEDYAVVANLYSPTRGISPLIRNLLLNPHVTELIVLAGTKEDHNSGSSKCLLDFFKCGFQEGTTDLGQKAWVIKSSITGYIDFEINGDALVKLIFSVKCLESNTVAEVIDYVNLLKSNPPPKPWGNPLTFPCTQVMPTIFPGTRYGHRIEGRTIAETWVKILHRIKTTGTIRPTGYDGQWQELIDLVAIITDEPKDFYFPEPNFLSCDRQSVENYVPQILEDAPYAEGVKYTYGQRLRSWFGKDQVKEVINKLIKEIDAPSAVMSLWDSGSGDKDSLNWEPDFDDNGYPTFHPGLQRFGRKPGDSDHNHGGSPCLNHIWLRVVDNELSMTSTFRSNDMFSAWPANAMGLRALQQHIRDEIAQQSTYDLRIGPLIIISQSAHIYDDCWEHARRVIEDHYFKICQQRTYDDPSGSFVITVNEEIVVEHISPNSGEVVRCYTGKKPLALIREISFNSPSIQPDHIGYLGIELQKAEQCLITNTAYVQDQS